MDDKRFVKYGIMLLLVSIFFIGLSISYSNGFNGAMNKFCNGKTIFYDSVKNVYSCLNPNVTVFYGVDLR